MLKNFLALLSAFFGLVIVLYFNLSMFIGITLIFTIPGIVILKKGLLNLKDCLFICITGFIGIWIIDTLSFYSGVWITHSYILSFRLQNNLTIDSLYWGISAILLIIGFWKSISLSKTKHIGGASFYYFLVTLAFSIVLIIENINPNLLKIPYFYLSWGLPFGIVSLIFTLLQGKNYLKEILSLTLFVFPFSFFFEYAAMRLNWWSWEGNQYIGWTKIFDIKFPTDETIIWFFLFPMIIIFFYSSFGINKIEKKRPH